MLNQNWWVRQNYTEKLPFLKDDRISNYVHSHTKCTAQAHRLCKSCSSHTFQFPNSASYDTHATVGQPTRGTYTMHAINNLSRSIQTTPHNTEQSFSCKQKRGGNVRTRGSDLPCFSLHIYITHHIFGINTNETVVLTYVTQTLPIYFNHQYSTMMRSLWVDKILLLRYMNQSTNFRR